MTKPTFLTPLVTKPRPDMGEHYVTLVDPLRYYSVIMGRVIEVPRGFPTDFASFKVGDLELRGKTDRPAVVHDDAYARGENWKTICDLLFYEACRAEGLGRFRAGLRFLAVWISPAAHRAWMAHRSGKSHAAKFYKTFRTQPDNHVNLP